MPEIEVHFSEYFDGETVAASAAGHEIFKAERLKTDMRTSLARVVHIEIPTQRTDLTFEVLGKGERAKIAVDAPSLKFVVVSLASGRLSVEPVTVEAYKREPRGYA
jgi:hypothetical protein